jgi:transcription elongation factor GreA
LFLATSHRGARLITSTANIKDLLMKTRQEPVQYLSSEGLAEARAQLERLVTIDRQEIIAKLRAAMEFGNLDENADYEVTRNEQSFVEGKIEELTALIRDAVIIAAPANNRVVDLGSTVEVTDEQGLVDIYTIVGSAEANPSAGRISNESPLGAVLLGAGPNQVVTVKAPAGEFRYTVTKIS